MKSSAKLQFSRSPSHAALRMSPVAAAVSTLLMTVTAVQAQQSPAAAVPDQTVVITGIRRGIESAISVKRNSDSIVEAISAEDLGKLPDQSIAESLARLPGLTAQRVAGRAQVITIRGLGPDFVGTLLNGRQQVSTGDNRSVEFDQFPSELINSVTVYKSPDAAVVGQGLSGTIDMKAIRPLDMRGRMVTFNARVESNSQGTLNANTTDKGKRFSVSYVNQFADNTVGVALGYAHLDTPSQTLHYKAWGFSTFPSTCRTDWGCGRPSGGPDGSTYLNGYEAEAISASQKRDGYMAVVEFKPDKNLHSTVDLYYSKFKRNETMRGLMGGFGENWNGVPGSVFTNVGTTQVGNSTTLISSANIANAVMVVRNDLNTRDDTLKSVGWNTKANFAGGWSAIADLSYSNAKRDENVIESYAGPYNGAAKVVGSFNATVPPGVGFPRLVPSLNYADVSTVKLSDPAVWGNDALWKKPTSDDTMKGIRMEVRRELSGMFTGLDFGLDYTTRTKAREMNELAAKLKSGRAPVAVAADLLQPTTSLSFAGIPGVLAYDVMGVLGRYYDVAPTAQGEIINRNYEVSEKVTTAFAKLGIDTTLAGVPVRGNAGLQFVHSDQRSHGFSSLSGTVTENTRGTSYDDVLPSVNLVFDLGSGLNLRSGIAKTMARGRMDDMRAGASASINATTHKWSGSGGNPELEPWRATSYDLSLEKYIGKRSYVAVAGFYKSLQNYIYADKNPAFDFSGIPNPNGLQTDGNLGEFTLPSNGNGGRVTGIEFSASLDAGLVAKALDGFGVIASMSLTESTLNPAVNQSLSDRTPHRLPGLSPKVSGVTVYYEPGSGFSARVAYRERSAYRGEITGLHNARQYYEFQPDRQTDMQMSYEFQSGMAKGLTLLLQVNNLTNSPLANKQGNGFGETIAPERYITYGRQTLLGLNYKL